MTIDAAATLQDARALTQLLGSKPDVPFQNIDDADDPSPMICSYANPRTYLDDVVHIIIDDESETIEVSPAGAPISYFAVGGFSVARGWEREAWPTAHMERIASHIAERLAEAKRMNPSERVVAAQAARPSEYTRDEMRGQFLDHARGVISYWSDLDSHSKEQAVHGAVFSMLTALDGEAGNLPGFVIAPISQQEDRDFLRGRGERWFPAPPEDACDIGGALHEEL